MLVATTRPAGGDSYTSLAPDLRIATGDDATASLQRKGADGTWRPLDVRLGLSFNGPPRVDGNELRAALGAGQYDAVARSGALAITGIGHAAQSGDDKPGIGDNSRRGENDGMAGGEAGGSPNEPPPDPTKNAIRAAVAAQIAAAAQQYGTPTLAVVDDIARRLGNYYNRMPTADEIANGLHLAFDPDENKFRGNEMDSAFRMEQQLGVRLQRAPPLRSQDFVEAESGKTWDVIGGDHIKSGTLDVPHFLTRLDGKLADGKADGIAVELAGRTPKEVEDIMEHINRLKEPLRAKVLIIGR